MELFKKIETLYTVQDEELLRSTIQKTIQSLKSKNKREDLYIDSFGIIHSLPVGITLQKGIHVIAKLNFERDIKGEKLIRVEYYIHSTQRFLIVFSVFFQCLLIPLLLLLFYLDFFSIESFLFKMMIALPFALILSVWFVFAAFNEQVIEISSLLQSVVLKDKCKNKV